jgi:hypothetical protein
MLKIDEKKFLFILLFLHLAIALPFAYYLNVWADEASTLHTTANGFLPAIEAALRDENQSPLYFILLSPWRMINGSIFWTRIFSILCSLLAIWISADVAKRFLPEYVRQYAVVIVALHPFLFWASTETRGYSLIILLSALLLKFFYDAYLADEPKLSSQILYILVCIVALYTNYFLGFFLVGNFFALVALRKTRASAVYIGHMAIVGIAFAPLFILLTRQFGTRHILGDNSLWISVRNVWQHLQAFILPINIFSEEKSWPAFLRLWIFRAAAAAIVAALLVKRFKDISTNTIALAAPCLLIALFLLTVGSLIGIGYANIRHASMLFLPLLFFFSALLYETFGRSGINVWAALLVFFIPFSIWQQFSPMAKRGDWEKVAAFVQANEKPDQAVMAIEAYDTVGFTAYYRGTNTVLPREGFFPWSEANDFTAPDSMPQQIDSLIGELPSDTPEVWLLTGEICEAEKTRDVCRPLEEYLDTNYTKIDDREFYLERVRLYRKK